MIRAIKLLFLSVLVVLILVGVGIGLVLNVIFTPEKITPAVVAVLNEQLNAEVNCESIELTFFETFPNFGANLYHTTIKTLETNTPKDTLISVDNTVVSFNLMQFLKFQNIDVKNIKLLKPELHAYVSEKGESNWSFLLQQERDSVAIQDTSVTDSIGINNIILHNFEIVDATLTYEDGTTGLTYRANSFSMQLEAEKIDKKLVLAVLSTSSDVEMYYRNKRIYQLKEFRTDLALDFDANRGDLKLHSNDISLNGVHFQVDGVMRPRPSEHRLEVELETKLTTNSIDHFVTFVPEYFLPRTDIETAGNVSLITHINGNYGNGELPVLDFELSLENGKLKYNHFQGEINTMQTLISGVIYPKDSIASEIEIHHLDIVGTGVDIHAKGTVVDLFNNAAIRANLKGDLNLTELYQKFPVDSSILLEGIAQIDLYTDLNLDQIVQKKYDKLNVAGLINLDHTRVNSDRDSLAFYSENLEVRFFRELKKYNKTHLNLELNNTQLHYKDKFDISADNLEATGDFAKTDSGKRALKVSANMAEVVAIMPLDSLWLKLKKTSLRGSFYPGDETQKPFLYSDFTIDSCGVKYRKDFTAIEQGNYSLKLDYVSKKIWLPDGEFTFKKMIAFSPKMPHPVRMPSTHLKIKNDNLYLDHSHLIYAETDLELTGSVEHVIGFFNGQKVSAKLDVQSNYINTNELMVAFSGIESTDTVITNKTEIGVEPVDGQLEADKHAFKIPDSLDFKFTTHVKKLKLGHSDFNNISGDLEVNNGDLVLKDLHMKTLAANLDAEVFYHSISNEKAAVDFTFYLTKIEMSKLNEFMPILDSLFPMTKSFMGTVDYRMKGKAEINQDFEIDVTTFEGIGAMKAKDIMVLDGPTFRDLAKTFMFKNKDLNPIDKLEVEVEFMHNDVNILPALIDIDRYELAMGGVQHLDMSYDYHISVLKSPVPFKAGVDLKGDAEDFKIDVTKAKYKYYFTEKERLKEKADQEIITKKADIQKQLGFN